MFSIFYQFLHASLRPQLCTLASLLLVALLMLITACTEESGSQAAKDSSPIFYESFNDISTVKSNQGSLLGNGFPDFVEGVKEAAADFSGSRALCYPLTGNFNITRGTLQFWVNTPEVNHLGVFDIGTLGIANSWGIFKNRNHWIMEIKNARNGLDQAWQPAPEIEHDGRWHLVTALWEKEDRVTSFKICYDDRCKAEYDGSELNPLTDQTGSFCVSWSGWYGYSDSLIDELRIYDYVKTDTQILNDFSSGSQ